MTKELTEYCKELGCNITMKQLIELHRALSEENRILRIKLNKQTAELQAEADGIATQMVKEIVANTYIHIDTLSRMTIQELAEFITIP